MTVKPAYFQQPDVITLPTLPTTQQVGGTKPATTSQAGNSGSGKRANSHRPLYCGSGELTKGEQTMPVDIGEAVLQVTAGGLPLDAYLAKLQRAIQAMRDVLNEPETDTVEVHD